MRALVIGASRGIGWETLPALTAYGHTAVALARTSPANAQAGVGSYLWIAGDARDPDVLLRALENADAVILTLGISHGELFKPVSLFSEATKVLIEAMKKRGVLRLIVVTGFGAGRSRSSIPLLQRLPFKLLFGRAYRDKDLQEGLVVNSGLDWTIVRPGVLTNGPRTGAYQVISDPTKWRNGLVSRKDVAAFLAQQVADPTYIKRDVVLVS